MCWGTPVLMSPTCALHFFELRFSVASLVLGDLAGALWLLHSHFSPGAVLGRPSPRLLWALMEQ